MPMVSISVPGVVGMPLPCKCYFLIVEDDFTAYPTPAQIRKQITRLRYKLANPTHQSSRYSFCCKKKKLISL